MNPNPSHPNLKLALFWGILGGLSALAVLPYALALNPPPEEVPLALLVTAQSIQSAILLFLGSWIGLRLGQPLALDSPWARSWVYGTTLAPIDRKQISIALALGAGAGLVIVALDKLAFAPFMPPLKNPELEHGAELWKGILASLYGAIGEELLLRLFIMTLITWLLWRLTAHKRHPAPSWIYWAAIVLSGILFGLGHLPTTAALWELTFTVISRGIVLNLIGGLAFGWLFWRWGLEYAMLSHFAADIVLRVLGAT